MPWLLLGALAVVVLLLAAGGIWLALGRTTPEPVRSVPMEETPAIPAPDTSGEETAGDPGPSAGTLAAATETQEAPTDATPAPSPGASPAVIPTAPATLEPAPFDSAALQAELLDLVNFDRTAAGLQPVIWDATAAAAGQGHAQEMVDVGYFSHWNIDGYGPDYRYTAAGGLHVVHENIFAYSKIDGEGKAAPVDDWQAVAQQAEASLMASEGHRANILAPEHTHAGIGIAYQPGSGEVRIVQEFVNQYADIQSPPLRAASGDRFVLRGSLHPDVSNPVANLAYEPFPEPATIEELDARTTYRSPAVFIEEPAVSLDGSDFVFEVTIPAGALPGLYHIRMWADTEAAENTQIVNVVVTVD